MPTPEVVIPLPHGIRRPPLCSYGFRLPFLNTSPDPRTPPPDSAPPLPHLASVRSPHAS